MAGALAVTGDGIRAFCIYNINIYIYVDDVCYSFLSGPLNCRVFGQWLVRSI